ncbi:MAG: AIR synthase family protein [Halobacteriales archaeon]
MTGDDRRLGKIDRELFEAVIAPRLGADRDDVALGPSHGVDFGVVDLGDRLAVIATDPISILPELGFERAGRLALDIVLADVAVSGIAPTHVAVNLTLPPAMTDDELAATWRGLAGYAEQLGVAVVAGHTARYAGIDTSWVGGATAFGIGDPSRLVRPDGARPGDAVVVSTGPAAEVAGLAAHRYAEQLDLAPEALAAARDRVDDIAVVPDALAAAGAGDVSAVHDATEGGLVGALAEMATGAGVGFEIDRARVPVQPGVEAVCAAIDVDPWAVTSAGTLVVTVAPGDADAVVGALQDHGTPAAVCGDVVDGGGVTLDGERVEPPEQDPSWAAFAALDERA